VVRLDQIPRVDRPVKDDDDVSQGQENGHSLDFKVTALTLGKRSLLMIFIFIIIYIYL
jgi:hypothetical protein